MKYPNLVYVLILLVGIMQLVQQECQANCPIDQRLNNPLDATRDSIKQAKEKIGE